MIRSLEFIGEIGEKEKNQFLGNAYALLFPIEWAEPFGLVMIEAMACGTPVIAFRRGSVSEVIDQGVTGFVVESIEESLRALDKVQNFDRRRCRQVFEERFSASRMADDYLKIYERLCRPKRPLRATRAADIRQSSEMAAAADAKASGSGEQ